MASNNLCNNAMRDASNASFASKAWILEDTVDLIQRMYGYVTTPQSPKLPTKQVLKTYRAGYSLDQISQELGVSTERVRQIEAAALRKCRKWCELNGYNLWDLLR